ncbi:oxygen-independent coproporphyrinogen-3 oxidase [Epibacterium ulvae]|uniref:Coproporphyrinogen-III oxidase n=1 Tax=Epibacterium ulvae TaxID=1156985 RepID=A0A1G5PJB5_9RHOB|nr:oxygen-independent coproporphyrinogen III oxidase [Epibacterium ulvae]SCZ49603.1 oxygen-independent coproporphyrinogen-3 oxidase [Epibacterium ulvae]
MERVSQLARMGLFDAKVPRYTSYPTAPHFNADVTPAVFQNWISQIPAGSQISLYLHIPFCRRLCWFCACRTQGTKSIDPVRVYVEILKQELQLLAEHLPSEISLSRLHWGGGTPTLLDAEMITSLACAITQILPFASGAEFSVEVDPNEIDGHRAEALAKAGMTRVSIGVQDFDPEIQETIGRPQSYAITQQAVKLLRAQGVTSLNADILYGLPHQTAPRVADSVQKLLSLNPDRVALYGYAHVPWMARRQTMIPSNSLPTPEARLQLFETARQLFTLDGYDEVGIDHFARPGDGLSVAQKAGRLRRNFQGYTDDTSEVLIGLGASSISRFPQGYAQNTAATSAYNSAIKTQNFATARGHIYQEDDAWRGRLIEMLMCDFRVDQHILAEAFPAHQLQIETLLGQLSNRFEGMVERTPQSFIILPEGRPLTRVIARACDTYELSKAGHSAAI